MDGSVDINGGHVAGLSLGLHRLWMLTFTTDPCTFHRRIERLLLTDTNNSDEQVRHRIDPQTAGLLLLSTTQLRKYAETHLPTHSRLREGFLEDVADLEDPGLGRSAKLHVVDRMWKSWGRSLGWDRAALHQGHL